LKKVSGGK